MTYVAGVDGCPSGWLVVSRPLDDPAAAEARIVARFEEILAIHPSPKLIAVDMPIGLPARSGIGGRPADVAARANLGARQSAVFAVPSRAAVMEKDYVRACEAALRTSDPPRKVSKQCFHLFRKIREIDAHMTPQMQQRVLEIHPEVAFWAMNRERALDLPKKVKSRPHDPGLNLRRELLARAGYDPAKLERARSWPLSKAGPDDLLDAMACSWSAARILRGEGRRFPETPEIDEKGLRMEIWG